jgi:hypothetical protein
MSRVAGTQVSGTVKRRRQEHLADDCPDFWNCRKLHRIMSSIAEADLLRYPGEWVLLDRREGVKYHTAAGDGESLRAMLDRAVADIGPDHRLVLHHVSEPGAQFYVLAASR